MVNNSRDGKWIPSEIYNCIQMTTIERKWESRFIFNGKETFTDTQYESSWSDCSYKTLNRIRLGLSPIEAGSEAIGSAVAQDEFSGSFFKNGILSGVEMVQLLQRSN